MLELLLGFVLFLLGCLYGNFVEWFVHRYILHALAKRMKNFRPLSFHLQEHHVATLKNDYRDPSYTNDPMWTVNPKTLEFFGILGMALPHVVLFWVSIPFAIGTLFWIAFHYFAHVISHVRPDIGKKYFRVHYDHHMGGDMEKNFTVTVPVMDYLFGTRKKFSGSKSTNK